LKINYHPAKIDELASALGCQVVEMPFTYSGLPLGTTKPTVVELMPPADRVKRRLTSTTF
jgi:hypothetical protein